MLAMLISARPRAWNILAATPVWVRMPTPTAEIFARPTSIKSSPRPMDYEMKYQTSWSAPCWQEL